MSTTDILVSVPLLPILPIVITWWLPWERWIRWNRIPKIILGPYFLYGAFAAWHFRLGWFATTVAAILGVAVLAIGIYKKF
jgi:hypothetical protein